MVQSATKIRASERVGRTGVRDLPRSCVLFKAPTGEQSKAQIEAFEDTWHWNDRAENAFDEVMKSGNSDVAEILRAVRSFLKENDMMAYLTMMCPQRQQNVEPG